MSLVNAHNAHNAHNNHNNHNNHAYDGGGTNLGNLAQAMVVAHDAITPMGEVKPAAPSPQGLSNVDRLRRIEFPFAVSALVSELCEGLQVKAEADVFSIAAAEGDIVTIRRPSAENLQNEAKLVAGYAELRAERSVEILEQTEQIHPFFMAILPMTPAWTPSMVLLAAVAEEMATAMVQRAKLGFCLPRPHALLPDILPMIACPGHSSFPSGHATQAFAMAGVLSAITGKTSPNSSSFLDKMAARIAVNRTVAGLHFPCDSAAGAVLGLAISRWLVARAQGSSVRGMTFNGEKWGSDAPDGSRDFHLPAFCHAWEKIDGVKEGQGMSVGKAPLLADLWDEAHKEWQRRWG